MPLPRPARLLRQCPALLRRQPPVRFFAGSQAACGSTRRRKGDVEFEEDDHELDADMSGQYFLPLPTRKSKQQDLAQKLSESELEAINRRIGEKEEEEQVAKGPFGLKGNDGEEFEDDLEYEPKEARRSPATLIGSKRIGMTVLPEELVEGVSRAIDDVDPHYVRRQFLQLREQRAKEPAAKKKKNLDVEPEMAVAVGAAFLPGEYAAARNVLEEMERRLGRDWLEKATEEARKIQLEQEKADGVRAMNAEEEVDVEEEEMSEQFKEVFRQAGEMDMGDGSRPRVIEASGSLGPGLWAMMDARGSLLSSTAEEPQGPVDYQFYHGPMHTRKFAHKLASAIPQTAGSIEYPPKFDRNFVSTTPAVVMSTFFLSTLPKIPQRNHVKKLLSFKSPYIILIDHARPAGWAAISKARQYIIEQNTAANPLHIVAPCPHEKECPLLNTADMCGFSQRIQAPRFLRKTKHSDRGEEDKKYVYLVVARGPRPTVVAEGEISELGRMGRVAKEQLEKQRAKEEGKGVFAPVEGSGSEHVHYERIPIKEAVSEEAFSQQTVGGSANDAESSTSALDNGEMVGHIRDEAYSWPRLVGPPLKKGGHIIMDVCAASGELERMTFAKSHSRQSYHDARKSYWGDLFPHPPKGRVTPRPRGVKRLLPEVQQANSPEENMAWMDELFGREPGAEAAEYESLKERPGVKISFDNAKRQRESWKTRSEMRKEKFEENLKMGKFYKLTKPEDYDDFPYDPKITYDDADVATKSTKKGKGKGKEVDMTAGLDELDRSEYWSPKPPVWLTGNVVPVGKVVHVDANDGPGPKPSGSSDIGGKRNFGTWTRPQVGLYSSPTFTQRRYMSARPVDRTTAGQRPKVTIGELARMKAADKPITVLTAYDLPTALLSESTGIDVVLVGDSLSQVALGHESTTSITLDEMIHHCKAVGRGAKTPFVIADLPFGSFEASVEKGVESAIRLIKEGGIDGVKIEGGREILPLIKRLSDVGIVAIPHVGLQPQRATSMSGYLVQGRSAEGATYLMETVMQLEQAGAGMFLLEAIPHLLGTHITQRVSVPTIGIGAGPGTSGQVLVITDVLGTYSDPALDDVEEEQGKTHAGQPRFVRRFGNAGRENRRAINEYIKGVKERSFPEIGKETYGMKKEEWELFWGKGKVVEGEQGEKGKGADTVNGA